MVLIISLVLLCLWQLFDVAFKQSLYDKGYVKNVPGSPMCGCIEKMPTVTRAGNQIIFAFDAMILDLAVPWPFLMYSSC